MVNTSIENSAKVRSRTSAIVNSDMFYRSLFEHNPDMVFFLDTYGIIAKVNEIFSKTIGYTQEEIDIKSIGTIFPIK